MGVLLVAERIDVIREILGLPKRRHLKTYLVLGDPSAYDVSRLNLVSLLLGKFLTVGLKQSITNWYQGKYVSEPPGSPFVMGYYQRHWSSRAVHTCISFYLKEWKWLLAFLVAVISAIVAIAKL